MFTGATPQSGRQGLSFLICGAGRGGTSLLMGMMDGHDRLEVGFEHSAVGCLMGESVRAHGRKLFHQRVERFTKDCDCEARRFPGRIYGNKITTEQLAGLEDHNRENPGATLDVLDLFFNHYLSGVKVVFILRDGRTCVKSKVARTGMSVEEACRRWLYSVEVCKFLRTRHANNFVVRYEDLVTAPEATLSGICDFLGIAFQHSMLRGTTSQKMPKEYRQGELDQTKLRLDDVPAQWEERIREGLRWCGYVGESCLR